MLLGHGRIGKVELDVPIYLSETWMAYKQRHNERREQLVEELVGISKRIEWDELADIVPDESRRETHLTLPPPDLLTADEVDAMGLKGWVSRLEITEGL